MLHETTANPIFGLQDGKDNNVTYTRVEYDLQRERIEKVNKVYNGIDSIRDYLLPSPNENLKDFAIRKEKSIVMNYVERITTAMVGMVFAKPHTFEGITDAVQEKLDEACGNKPLFAFMKELTEYAIVDGKSYVMIDRPVDGGDPYFVIVRRQQLTNWRKNASGRFTFAVIREVVTEDKGFAIEYKTQYRVLREDGSTEIYREVDGEWKLYDSFKGSHGHVALYELGIDEIPPLYDIATININHYNAYSKKDQYLDTAGSPIPFGKGLGIAGDNDLDREDEPQVVLGVNSMILTDNTEASLEWVEMSGGSIEALQDDLERKEKAMAERALSLIQESKTKTATQVDQENAERNSRLSDIAGDLEVCINNAFNAWHKMVYIREATGMIIVNKDFNPTTSDINVALGLNSLQVSGNLSKETLLKALVKHEVVDIDDIDEEIRRIDEESFQAQEPVQ